MLLDIKVFVLLHRFYFSLISIIFISAVVLNLLVGNERAFVVGEYVFSFDYRGHLAHIFEDFASGTDFALNSQACEQCPAFFHYSRWYSFFKLGLYSIGEFLGFNAFVFFLLLSVIIQLSSLYIFVRVHFQQFSRIIFLISSFVFIVAPIRFALIGESNEGLTYSLFVLYFAFVPWLMQRISHQSNKDWAICSFIFGFLCSGFMSISVSHLPIFVYLLGFTLVIYFLKWRFFWIRFLVFLFASGLVAVLLNIPFIWSVLNFERTRIFTNYHSFPAIDAFSLFTNYSGTNFWLALLFIVLLLYLFFVSELQWKYKLFLLSSYILCSLFIMGVYSPIPVYDWIFKHVFLMDTIRATHKFLVFQLLIAFIVTYSGLLALRNKPFILFRIIYLFIIIFFLILPVQHAYAHRKDIRVMHIPESYFQLDSELKDKSSKVYFPHSLPWFKNITGNYSWSSSELPRLLYTNPFNSLFSLPNLYSIDYYWYSPKLAEIHSLTDFSVPVHDIVRALEFVGIDTVIVDRYFLWSSVYKDFDVDGFASLMPFSNQFGELSVYNPVDRSKECKPSYGNFRLGYCFVTDSEPQFLVDTTVQEYFLEDMLRNDRYIVDVDNSRRFPSYVLDPNTQHLIVTEKLFIPQPVYTIDQELTGIFYRDGVQKENYILAIGMLHFPENDDRFKQVFIEIQVGDTVVSTLSPSSVQGEFGWSLIELKSDVFKNIERVGINFRQRDGSGSIVMSTPLLFTESEWHSLQSQITEASGRYTIVK